MVCFQQLFRNSIRNEKQCRLHNRVFRMSFCLEMDVLEADYSEYQDATGVPLDSELIHECVRIYLKFIDISNVLSFFMWVKYWNSCKTDLQRNVSLEPEPINLRWWSRSLKFGSWLNKHCLLTVGQESYANNTMFCFVFNGANRSGAGAKNF